MKGGICHRAALLGVAAILGCSSQTFDSQRWQRADIGSRERAEMVDDLLRGHRLIGRSRREVVALLGPPTETDKFQDWHLVYVLGPQDGPVGIDHEWLLIRLNDSGMVAEARVEHD